MFEDQTEGSGAVEFKDGDVIYLQAAIGPSDLLPIAESLLSAWQCAKTTVELTDAGSSAQLAAELTAKKIEASLQQLANLYSLEEDE